MAPKKVMLVANERIAVIELDRAVFEQGESVNADGVELLVTVATAKSIVERGLAHYKSDDPAPVADETATPVKE